MTEDEKMQVAIFRFSVISDFINAIGMNRVEKRRLMRDKCARKWQIPISQKTRISKETIKHWISSASGYTMRAICKSSLSVPALRPWVVARAERCSAALKLLNV